MNRHNVPTLGSRAGAWTRHEVQLLRRQLREGKKQHEISIPGRTVPAIDNQMRRWRFHTKSHWTRKEKALLKRQVADGIAFEKLAVPGRSTHAVAGMYAKLFGIRRKPWSEDENQELLQKLAADPEAKNITLPGRTAEAVNRQLYELGWHSPAEIRWTANQDKSLKDQLAAGIAAADLTIEGRTKLAVRYRAIKLGLYKPKPIGIRKPWDMKQIRWLRQMAFDQKMTARQISLTNLFPGRSVNAISGQIRNLQRQGTPAA